ncbi:MAG TPA: hypothetical protein DEA05_02380 [Rhodobacteraceae bacterium]|nr:hypothetical protein [Paracoccaceae bacterium]
MERPAEGGVRHGGRCFRLRHGRQRPERGAVDVARTTRELRPIWYAAPQTGRDAVARASLLHHRGGRSLQAAGRRAPLCDVVDNTTEASLVTRVFISHASRDIETVQRLARGLESRGIEVWLAPEQIEFGQDYADRLMDGMKGCDATVVVLSVDAMRSRHVRREIEIANDLGHRFYPVRLLELTLAQEFSYFLNDGRWIDLFSGDAEARYDELAEAIRTGRDLADRQVARDRRRFWGRWQGWSRCCWRLLSAWLSISRASPRPCRATRRSPTPSPTPSPLLPGSSTGRSRLRRSRRWWRRSIRLCLRQAGSGCRYAMMRGACWARAALRPLT